MGAGKRTRWHPAAIIKITHKAGTDYCPCPQWIKLCASYEALPNSTPSQPAR